MRPTTLLLVRHGESGHNAAGRWQGQTDVPLSTRGEAQAARVAERLALDPPSAVYTSDLLRAHVTARAIAERCGAPLHTDERLREIHIGRWAGLTTAEIREGHASDWAAFLADGDGTHRRGAGESAREVGARVCEAIAEIAARHAGERVAVVSHGFAIRTYIGDLLGMPYPARELLTIGNCGLSAVTLDGEGAARLLFLNDTSHL